MTDEAMSGGGSAVLLRRARPEDGGAVAEVYLAAFKATYVFPLAHTDDQVRRWIAAGLVPTQETWLAVAPEADDGPSAPGARDTIVGLMALGETELDHLYLRPGWWRQGIGSRLVELAKERRPAGLSLYTFQVNGRARAFYERHGFIAVWFGDGSTNEERQPDVRYEWRPARLIDRRGPAAS